MALRQIKAAKAWRAKIDRAGERLVGRGVAVHFTWPKARCEACSHKCPPRVWNNAKISGEGERNDEIAFLSRPVMESIIIFRTVGEQIACDAVVMELLRLAFPSGTPSNEQIAQFKLHVRLPGWAGDGTNEVDVIGYDGCYVSDLRTFSGELRECLGGGRNQATLEGYTALFRLRVELRRDSDFALVLGRIRAPACVPEDWSQRARYSMEHEVMDFPFSLEFGFPALKRDLLEAAAALDKLAENIDTH